MSPVLIISYLSFLLLCLSWTSFSFFMTFPLNSMTLFMAFKIFSLPWLSEAFTCLPWPPSLVMITFSLSSMTPFLGFINLFSASMTPFLCFYNLFPPFMTPAVIFMIFSLHSMIPFHDPLPLRRYLWCNSYRRRIWTWRHEFKSWMRLIAFHIVLIPLGKVWIQSFSLQLWVNSMTD